jgi:NADH-quinone oxidoreductase subunit J
MNLETILFFIFGLIAAISSILMITRNNAVIAALYLILNFASLAGLYLILNAQFIAVAQVIVYAGAIMVLFLFVIMLLRPENEKKFLESNPKVKIFAFIIAGFVFLQLVYIIFFSRAFNLPFNNQASVEAGKIESIGYLLFKEYVLPFEAAGFLLLAATIGALILAKKKIN